MIAALYIDRRGPYWGRPDVDAWDIERDARKYAGPWPVVAHPPCGPWGRLRHLSRNQDPACAPLAVEQVRRFGGVLEHPAQSKLWGHCGLPLPGELPDAFGGYSIAVHVGVAIVGRPSSRELQDGWTAEVTRVATDGTRNACSFLYGACWRAARALAYRRLVTYTLASESGASLRASGWHVVAEVRPESWDRAERPRVDKYPQQAKLRWEAPAA